MGGNGVEKKKVPTFLRLCFFQRWKKTESKKCGDSVFFQSISPPCLGLCFFQSTKTGKCSPFSSFNFSGPGFWILTKGGIRQPVLGLPCPNSIQVLGMEQPNGYPFWFFVNWLGSSAVKFVQRLYCSAQEVDRREAARAARASPVPAAAWWSWATGRCCESCTRTTGASGRPPTTAPGPRGPGSICVRLSRLMEASVLGSTRNLIINECFLIPLAINVEFIDFINKCWINLAC